MLIKFTKNEDYLLSSYFNYIEVCQNFSLSFGNYVTCPFFPELFALKI